MADCPGILGVLLARSWIVNGCEEHMMGTEKMYRWARRFRFHQRGLRERIRRSLAAVALLSRRCLRRVRSASNWSGSSSVFSLYW